MAEPQDGVVTPVGQTVAAASGEARLPYGVAPTSNVPLTCLRLAGWLVAISGVLGGAVTLAHTPEGLDSVDTRFRGIYLAVGWGLMVGGVAGGILLNVVAGVGSAVFDMWKSWYTRA